MIHILVCEALIMLFHRLLIYSCVSAESPWPIGPTQNQNKGSIKEVTFNVVLFVSIVACHPI